MKGIVKFMASIRNYVATLISESKALAGNWPEMNETEHNKLVDCLSSDLGRILPEAEIASIKVSKSDRDGMVKIAAKAASKGKGKLTVGVALLNTLGTILTIEARMVSRVKLNELAIEYMENCIGRTKKVETKQEPVSVS
jgi:hypothetical protein